MQVAYFSQKFNLKTIVILVEKWDWIMYVGMYCLHNM
jgi:hypothetical protein